MTQTPVHLRRPTIKTVHDLILILLFIVVDLYFKMTKISIKETKPSSMLTKVNMTVTKKSYWLYDSQYLFDCLMEFACLSGGTSINSFIRSKEKIAKSSFLHYFHKSGLADLKEKGPVDVGIAKILLSIFLAHQ